MPKKKLILICQFGGEFVTIADGSLKYKGGEANAVDINPETLCDDLKMKLAEMFDLEYKSLSMKYFLPGNRRTLITLANDKDLKRMLDFHNDSITADVFLLGQRGFIPEDLKVNVTRPYGIKHAETVPVVVKIHDAAADFSIDNATAQSSNIADLSSSPADTVKKRRRTASWKIGAHGPTIVSVPDTVGNTRKSTRRKSLRNLDDHMVDVVVEERPDFEPMTDMVCHYPSTDFISKDGALEDKIESWKEGIVGVGQDFDSVVEFRDALQKYAIAHRFVYKLKKNDTNRASGVCVVAGCSWSIHASWVPTAGVFRIKKMNEAHTCGGESWKVAHPKKGWLVSIIKDRLIESPHHKPKDIAKGILQDFGVRLNYTQVWRGIDEAREQLQGSYKQSYTQLPWFCDKMVEANPGSFLNLCIGDDNKFQRLFVSFSASIHGFKNGCRPLIFLDSTPLKSKYHEILLTATALDGNDDPFPVSFAVADIENDDNWCWFLEQLRSAISAPEPITFVSDNEKGLMKPVLETFENNAHFGYSLYHMLDNFRISLRAPFQGDGKGTLPASFLAAARAVRLDSFKNQMEQIKQVSSKAYDWLMQFEPQHWANSLFKGERYNHINVDTEEFYFDWIEEVRELPIIQKVEELRCKIMELMRNRQTDSYGWTMRLTPTKEKKLNEEALKALPLRVLFSSDTLFEVHDDSINVVDLAIRDCTCQQWKLTGIPCCHAVAVFNRIGKSAYDYCSKYFTTDSFRASYSESIYSVSETFKHRNEEGEEEGGEGGEKQVLPPTTPRPAVQTRERRSRSKCEMKRVMTCTRCRGEGHNKATCKEPLEQGEDV